MKLNKTNCLTMVWLLMLVALVSCSRTEVDTVLQVDFTYAVTDSNYAVPVRINFINKTSGAQFYKWTFTNGSIAESNLKDPGYVTFAQPGPIGVKLEAWNDYDRKEKTITIVVDTLPVADFMATPRVNNFAPAEWDFSFTGKGATTYAWSFENGSSLTSTDRHPQAIKYTVPGTYKIKLWVRNDRNKSDSVIKYITVKPALAASFEVEPSFDDDDGEAPLTAKLHNSTTNATSHVWQASGGTLTSATDSLPSITFVSAGTYTITYTASNGKQTEAITKTITVKPNTFLRQFTNIKLGINTAHETIGSFFSTYLRKVIKKDSVNAANGPFIDLCYFGLNQNFSFNKFLSPKEVKDWTFTAIPGAVDNILINKQETCSCGTNLSAAAFDAITDGSFFNGLSVIHTAGGIAEFDNTVVPRVVLFKNAAGKTGAIKIKQFVNNGHESYILCDIKVQKN